MTIVFVDIETLLNIAAGARSSPELLEDVVSEVCECMIMRREHPPPPHTHSKHSKLQKARGHKVCMRRDPV